MSDSVAAPLARRASTRWGEKAIESVFLLCALVSVVTTGGIILVLARETLLFFQDVALGDFLFGTRWSPIIKPHSHGVLPLLAGSMQIVLGSALIAIPVGVASAVYLSEYASKRTRKIVKPILEVLAGIPTVVYGYFALTAVTPIMRTVFGTLGLESLLGEVQVYNGGSASIVVGIMILPMVASFCDDALRAVPDSLRSGALALGATRFEVSVRVVLPAALSGIVASLVLAFSRAIGETMAVTIAAGANPTLTLNPVESIQTMTAYIAQVTQGDMPAGTTGYHTLFAVGSLLFVITLAANLVGHGIMRRYREVYE